MWVWGGVCGFFWLDFGVFLFFFFFFLIASTPQVAALDGTVYRIKILNVNLFPRSSSFVGGFAFESRAAREGERCCVKLVLVCANGGLGVLKCPLKKNSSISHI